MVEREPNSTEGIAGFLLVAIIGVTLLGIVAFYVSQFLSGGGHGIFSFQPVIVLFAIAWAILIVVVGTIVYNTRRKSGRM